MTRRVLGRPAWSACLLLVTVSASASAQTSPSPPRPADPSSAASTSGADTLRAELYRSGVRLANEGRWAEAVARFRQVVEMRPAPPALFSLGQAEEHVGHLVAANRAYLSALSSAGSAGAPDVADAARKALAAIQPRLAHILVRVGSHVDQASATLDGDPVKLGEAFDVDPGDHQITVAAPNRKPDNPQVRVVAGETREVVAWPNTDAAEPANDVTTGPPRSPSRQTATGARVPVGPIVLGSLGLVAGVVGIVVRQTAQSSFDAVAAQCPNGCPTSSLVDEGNPARTRIIAGEVTLGVAIAALVGAGVWWIVTPKARTAGTGATPYVISF
jgi:hypothetical protein